MFGLAQTEVSDLRLWQDCQRFEQINDGLQIEMDEVRKSRNASTTLHTSRKAEKIDKLLLVPSSDPTNETRLPPLPSRIPPPAIRPPRRRTHRLEANCLKLSSEDKPPGEDPVRSPTIATHPMRAIAAWPGQSLLQSQTMRFPGLARTGCATSDTVPPDNLGAR